MWPVLKYWYNLSENEDNLLQETFYKIAKCLIGRKDLRENL